MPSVMIIDNNRLRGELIRSALQANGYQVDLVTCIQHASTLVRQHWPEAVFLAEGVVDGMVEQGVLGRVLYVDPDSVDRVRLDALLQLAADRLHSCPPTYVVETISVN